MSSEIALNEGSRDMRPLGLNNLSAAVLNYLKQNPVTTFSEVADMIIKNVSSKISSGEVSGEKTTRRRVYDVLNVLLASGIITKDNKKIIMMISCPKETNDHDDKLNKATEEDEVLTLQKKQQVVRKVQLYLTYKSLLARNQNNEKPPNAVPLPAILVGFNSPIDCISNKSSAKNHSIEIHASENPAFYSPNDVFRTIDFSNDYKKRIFSEMKMFSKLENDVFPLS